jgi:two-component system, LytTR family, sensor kinase
MPLPSDAGLRPGRIAAHQVFAVATLLGLIASGQHNILMRAQNGPENLWHALGMGMPYWYLWALFFPLVAVAARRFPFSRDRWLDRAAVHLAIALAITVLHSLLEMGIHHAVGTRHSSFGLFTRMSLSRAWWQLPYNLLAYAAILALAVATESSYRARRERVAAAALGTELAEARLEALRAQLNPHFLFNAMNSIAMLVRRNDNATAVTMIAGLSDLMRSFLGDHPPQEVSLREELAFLDRYLAVERLRFQDRLQVRIDTDLKARDGMVPNLVLQPLVENAIKHGISRRAAAGRLDIEARSSNGTLTLTVRDDGPGLSGAEHAARGVGLRNVRTRLEHLYGAAQSLTLEESPGGGALATVTLPYRVRPA